MNRSDTTDTQADENAPQAALPEAPTLYVVFGPPGVGKTTVGEMLATELGIDHSKTDTLRHSLIQEPTYSQTETAMVYDELLKRARSTLADGNGVVCDGTFSNGVYRQQAKRVAQQTGSQLRLLFVTCDDESVRERITDRDGLSDADIDVYESIVDEFDPIEQAYTTIDNSGSLAETRSQLVTQIDAFQDG